MRRPNLTLPSLVFFLLLPLAAFGQSAADRVQRALDAQDKWLATQATGAGWNQYLQTDELKAQLAKGDQADPIVVRKILSKYEAKQPGLRLAHLVSTRKAITAWADQLHKPTPAQLLEHVRAAKDSYKPVAKADVIARQVAAEGAVRRLEKYLRASGANGAGWIAYLQLDKLKVEVAKGLEARPDQLRASRARLVSGLEGLELPQFSGVASSLRSYADLLAAYQGTDAQSQYDQDLTALGGYLEAASKSPADFDRRGLGQLLGKMIASGQSPTLLETVRKQFCEPNLRVQVSDYVVTAGIGEDVDENTPISDVILGTDISGRGRTRATVKASLVPNDDCAQIDIVLKGKTTSKTVGTNGPATIFSSATTSLAGQKEIFLDARGFRSDRAHAECETNSNIDGISIDAGRLITRIATNRVYSSHDTAEAIASEHAESRLEGRMDKRTSTMLTDANRSYDNKFRNPLMRRAAFPQDLDFSTTKDWLTVVGLQARPGELGAPSAPPDIAADAQLSIRAHESLVENLADVMLAGRTARDEDFNRMARNIVGSKLSHEEFKVLLRNLGDGSEIYKDFSGLIKDRFEQNITSAEFDKLVHAINDKQLSQAQYDSFLKPLLAEPVSLEQANAMFNDLPERSQGSLTFADVHPLSVKFGDNSVKITLHTVGHTSRTGVERPIPMDITVTYKFEFSGGTLVSKRQGEIEVSPPGFKSGDSLDVQQTTARRTLRTRFEDIFQAETKSTGLTLRGRWKKLGELPWTQMVIKDGWVVAGWKVAEGKNAAE